MGLARKRHLFLGTKSYTGIRLCEGEFREKQFNRIPIKVPFVLGAIIDLGNCLNLVESESIEILKEAYSALKEAKDILGEQMPVNAA
jgi:hypothetical protein